MKTTIKFALLCLMLLTIASCGDTKNEATDRLKQARQYYRSGEYALAKQEIDSIKTLHPKAFTETKAALILLDSVRRGENIAIIASCDSLIKELKPQIEDLKKGFTYQRNKEYQDKGFFVPKESALGGQVTATTLRSGVMEDGSKLYLESIFVGSQRHNKIKVTTKDGAFAESLAVTDDGSNFRFSNQGIQRETIQFVGASENGVARFITENKDKQLTLSIEGQSKYAYPLSQPIKNAVAKSYELSKTMSCVDSLKTAREKAEFKIYYLDNGKKTGTIIEDEKK